AFHPIGKRPPVQKQANQENEQGSFYDFFPESRITTLLQTGQHKSKSIAHCKEEKRKYQVGRGEPMPGSMLQRRIYMAPTAGIIYQDHEANSGPAEYVEGVEAVQGGCTFYVVRIT